MNSEYIIWYLENGTDVVRLMTGLSVQLGVNEAQWDEHTELHTAIDDYRVRRQKATAFLQWALTRKAHQVAMAGGATLTRWLTPLGPSLPGSCPVGESPSGRGAGP